MLSACLRFVVGCVDVLICMWFLFRFFLLLLGLVGSFCLESTFFVFCLSGELPSSHALLCVLVGRAVVSLRCLKGVSRGAEGSLLLLLCRSGYALLGLLAVASILGCCRMSRELLRPLVCDISRSLFGDCVYLRVCSGDRGFDLSMGDVGALDLCPSPKDLGVLSRLSASVCVRSCSCLPC